MNIHSSIQELITQLRQADLQLNNNTVNPYQGLLDFDYETPLSYNGFSSLVTFDQHLEGLYTISFNQLKNSLKDCSNIELQNILLELKLSTEELKLEFKKIGDDTSLSRVKVSISDYDDIRNNDLESLKKKHCSS